jgi:hypothetical protein
MTNDPNFWLGYLYGVGAFATSIAAIILYDACKEKIREQIRKTFRCRNNGARS